ncbi:MAG: FAD-binding oxidoreductase [Planctomycetota bacterium]
MNAALQDAGHPSHVVDYPVDDMTITVRAELTMGQLATVLAQHHQQLPIDAEDDSQTIGELVMRDVAGPRQYGCGTLRDYVIGIEAVDGHGRRFHAGGRVVKNVAGYDLCRLLVGSEGHLGQVTMVTLKVRPLPPATALIAAAFPDVSQLAAVLERLNTSATTPVILDVVNDVAARRLFGSTFAGLSGMSSGPPARPAVAYLLIGFDGSPEACRWQPGIIARELSTFTTDLQPQEQSGAFADWCRIAQQASRPEADAAWLSRLTILPSRVASAVAQASTAGCEIFGRAGSGILFVRPPAGRQVDESATLRRLQPLLAPPGGSLRVLKGNTEFNTRPSLSVQQLSMALQQALATTGSAN